MIDLTYIRENPDEVKAAMETLHMSAPIDEVVELDAQRRDLLRQVEALRAKRNRVSKEIPRMEPEEREKAIAEMREVAASIDTLDEELAPVEEQLERALLQVPNLPDPSVPVGADEHENVIVETEGEIPSVAFEPLPHWDLGENLGIIDFERGVKISGSRFYILKGLGARLQRATIRWMLDVHTKDHGYTEVYPPFVVLPKCLYGTGQLPKFAENLYYDSEDDLWLIPTAEVPITNMYREEILAGDALPIYHTAYTPCFRREKMSAGKDTRGIKRGHQFDKVEMVKFVRSEDSMDELDSLVENARDICRRLDLPHRVVQMCTGDLSFTASVKYDIEVWAQGCQEWLEVSSCSNFKDFQSRRANIRYRDEDEGDVHHVHTLNGSGLALPRVMIAVLENYQQEDGSVVIPEVLRPYMDGEKVIRP
ncbi:MAG: serine--tRNA ligase [Anaerolineales bacterium]